MNFLAPSPADPDSAGPNFDDGFDAREQTRLRKLARLGDILLEAAEALGRRIAGAEPAPGDPVFKSDPGLVLTGVARALRQTVALETRFEEERRARLARSAAEEAARLAAIAARNAEAAEAAAEPAGAPTQRQKQRVVEYAVERAVLERDPSDAENLLVDLVERLDRLEDDPAVWDLPVGAIVMLLCRHMKLTPDLALWADDPWAVEERRTRPPGSPYLGWTPEPEPEPEPEPAFGLLEPKGGAGPPE